MVLWLWSTFLLQCSNFLQYCERIVGGIILRNVFIFFVCGSVLIGIIFVIVIIVIIIICISVVCIFVGIIFLITMDNFSIFGCAGILVGIFWTVHSSSVGAVRFIINAVIFSMEYYVVGVAVTWGEIIIIITTIFIITIIVVIKYCVPVAVSKGNTIWPRSIWWTLSATSEVVVMTFQASWWMMHIFCSLNI